MNDILSSWLPFLFVLRLFVLSGIGDLLTTMTIDGIGSVLTVH